MKEIKCYSCGEIIEIEYNNNPIISDFCSVCIGIFSNYPVVENGVIVTVENIM